ncbi:S-layer homology domain-containing protein [Paenibacillus kobensis]|uniref:S-layer homology domain-containing protein n=1 Tax=Paenibacillus kobensis TaxID=59841 RepID=UPI000FDB1DB2|nr:S-layer homology domain-containing protein [Paenibacillus kobensis]
MARIRTWLACIMAVMLIAGAMPVYAEEAAPDSSSDHAALAAASASVPGEYVRIKNKWQNNYLYESSDGIVRYGFTASADESSQWKIEDAGATKRIKNKKTGHYMTIAEVAQRRDALTSRAITESTASDRWYIEPASREGYVLIKSATVDSSVNLVVHEEDQLGYAEASSDITVSFESPQWMFEPVTVLQPVRIINQDRAGQALYEKANPDKENRPDDVVAFGSIDSADTSGHWYLEPGDNGTVRLLNRATGRYIAQFGDGDFWRPIEMGATDDPLKLSWNITDSINDRNEPVPGFVTISSAFDGTYVLNTQFPTDNYARSNNWSNKTLANAHWLIVPVSDVKPVRIVNYTDGTIGTDYLYEAGGAVKHGALGAGNANNLFYQWIVEDFDGGKRIRNAATGRYVLAGDPLHTAADSGDHSSDQWRLTASSQYDDYVTIRSASSADSYLNVSADAEGARSSAVDPNSNAAQWLLEDPSVPTDGSPQYIRIQNEWQSYVLYEDEHGELKYGNIRADQKDQWVVEKFHGRKRIKNRATGHYINLQSMNNGRIQVSAVEDSWTSAVWIIETVSGGSRLIHSVNDPSSGGETDRLINLQNLGKYAEYAVINRNWGSPKWRFINVIDDRPTIVQLVNKQTGLALYEAASSDPAVGTVKYGDVDASDAASVWLIEDTGEGSIRLKNSASGHYIAMQSVGDTDVQLDSPPQTLEALATIYPSWGSAKWIMDTTQDAGFIALRSGWAAHYVKAEDTDGAVKVSKAVKGTDGSFAASAQFSVQPVETKTELPEGFVRIRNIFNQQYLYENSGGVVLYGSTDASNGYSHWRMVTKDGVTQLQNRVTGHVMAVSGDYRYIGSVEETGDAASSGSASDWAVEPSADGASVMFRSKHGSFNDEYLNVQNGAGYAERGLYPASYGSLQWQLSAAPEQFDTPTDGVERNEKTETPALPDRNYVRIAVPAAEGPSSGNLYVTEGADGTMTLGSDGSSNAAQWLMYDYNGRRLFENRATGRLLALGEADTAATVAKADAAAASSQWLIEESAGYRTIRSAAGSNAWLAQDGGSLQAASSTSGAASLWSLQPVVSDIKYEAEDAFVGGGAKAARSAGGFTGQGYVDGFTTAGAKLIAAVHAQTAGNYQVAVRYLNDGTAARSLDVYVNGLPAGALSLPVSKGWSIATVQLALREGINSVTVQPGSGDAAGISIDSITVQGSTAPAYRGATVPYITYEAEQGATNGTVLEPSRVYREVASEASGRQAVRLDETGQYVEFKTAEAANSIVVRFSIPDSADGTGQSATLGLYVNGEFRQKLQLNSKHAWEYGSYPWSNDPNQGNAHRFFDDMHALIGDVPAGSTIRLEKDADSTADYYVIDLADLEQVAAPLAKPAGMVAVTEYGAVPGDGLDDTAAFQEALEAAKLDHKGIWVPQGEFELRGDQLVLNDVTIRGAGMWYTTLTGARFMGKGTNIQVYDLLVDGDLNVRDDEAHTHAFEGGFGTGSVIQNVWVEHSKTGLWLTKLKDSDEYTDSLYMVGMRLRNLMADGINFCVGTSNSMMEQTDIRYSGDDGIAMWSAEGRASVNNTARFNTVSLPWLADNIVVFGGTDNKIQDNIAKDTITNGAGIAVSTRFNPVPFAGTTIVERNTMIRTGSYDTGYTTDLGALWLFAGDKKLDGNVIIRNNVALDSTYSGLSVLGSFRMDNVVLQDLVIDGVGTKGVDVSSTVSGGIVADNIIVRDARIADVSNGSGSFELKERNEGFASLAKPFTVQLGNGATSRFALEQGSSFRLKVFGADGADVTAQSHFVSADALVAVQEDGLLTALKEGKTEVTVTYGGATRVYTVQVYTQETLTEPGTNNPGNGSNGNIGTGIGGGGSGSSASSDAASDNPADNDRRLSGSKESVVVFTVDGSPGGAVPFTVHGLQAAAAAHSDGAIEIRNGSAAYTFPLGLVHTLLERLAVKELPAGAVMTFTAAPVQAAAVAQKLEQQAKSQGLQLLGKPVEFGISVQIGDKNVTVDSFGGIYVTRTIIVDGELDAASSTALVYDSEAGQWVYVPAVFSTAGGKTTVTIKSTSNSVYAVAKHPVTFGDMAGHWARSMVEQLAVRTIVNGVSAELFAPNRPVTRAEFASMLVRSLGLRDGSGEATGYSDVPADAWYADAVGTASRYGIVQGMQGGSFQPSERITREQMAVMIARAFDLAVKGGLTKPAPAASASSFNDNGEIHAWASEAVLLAVQQGIMQGRPSGDFAPGQQATRAESAVVIGRLLQTLQLMNK